MQQTHTLPHTHTHTNTGLAVSGLRGEAVISPNAVPHESEAACRQNRVGPQRHKEASENISKHFHSVMRERAMQPSDVTPRPRPESLTHKSLSMKP